MAAAYLGWLREARAVEPLLSALEDSDPQVRQSVRLALAEIGASLIAPLLATFEGRGGEEQDRALPDALRELRGSGIVDQIVAALSGGADVVRAKAAMLLGWIGDDRSVVPLARALEDPLGSVRRAAAGALAVIDQPLVTPLLSVFEGRGDGGEEEDRRPVEDPETIGLRALRGTPVVPKLIAALRAEQELWGAIMLLGWIGDERAIGPLVDVTRGGDEQWAAFAVQALGSIGGPVVLPVLFECLHDRRDQVRVWAELALARIGYPAAVPELLRALGDESEPVRAGSARALAALCRDALLRGLVARVSRPQTGVIPGTPATGAGHTTSDILAAVLKAPPPSARPASNQVAWAVRVLETVIRVEELLGPLGLKAGTESREDISRGVGPDEDALSALAVALTRDDVVLRECAAMMLGTLDDPRAVGVLRDTLADSSARVRLAAVRGLGRIEFLTAVKALIDALDGDDRGVRDAAALALRSIGDKRGLQALAERGL